jgi:hypothetical protein
MSPTSPVSPTSPLRGLVHTEAGLDPHLVAQMQSPRGMKDMECVCGAGGRESELWMEREREAERKRREMCGRARARECGACVHLCACVILFKLNVEPQIRPYTGARNDRGDRWGEKGNSPYVLNSSAVDSRPTTAGALSAQALDFGW